MTDQPSGDRRLRRPDRARRAVLLGAAVLLAGCSTPTDALRDIATSVPPAGIIQLRGCPRDASLLASEGDVRPVTGSVPAGFHPSVVTRCVNTASVQREGQDRYTFTQSRAPVTDEVLELLARPDQEFTNRRTACAAVGQALVVYYLSDARHRTIRPRLPAYPCGTRPDVADGLAKLPFVEHETFVIDVPV